MSLGSLGLTNLGLGSSARGFVSNLALMSNSLNNGDGLALDFLTDTALVVDADSTDGSELSDGTFNTVSPWTASGTNTVEVDGDAIKITYVDNANGAESSLTQSGILTEDLVAGDRYLLSFEAKVQGGNVTVTTAGAQTAYNETITETSYTAYSGQFISDGSEVLRTPGMAAGEIVWIRNLSVTRIDNSYFDRIRDLLTVTNTLKHVTGPDGNLRYQAHNLCLRSETLSQSPWQTVGGGTCVDNVVEDADASGLDGWRQTFAVVSGEAYKAVWYILKDNDTSRFPEFQISQSGNIQYNTFNTQDGTVGERSIITNNGTATVSDGGTHWILEQTLTTTGTSASLYIYPAITDTIDGAADVTLTGTVQVDKVHFYRSPADETYVATTSAAKYGLALDHDVTTLDSSSTSVSVGTGKRTFTLAGSTDYRTATTAWAAASELVTNGGFDADTDWTKGGTWAISGGQASAGGSSGSLTQAISLTANTYYEVTYEVVSITSGNVKFQFQGGAANVGTIRSTPGTYTEVIENTDNDTLAFVSGGTTPDAVIDNVTITEYRAIGDQRQVNNRSYTCIVAHTSSGANKPSGEGNAYWKRDEKYLRISDQSDVDGKYLVARVDYQTGTTLVVDVLRAVGSGSASSWHVIEAKGALIEEARTNLWTYSQDISQSVWESTSRGATITANDALASNGEMIATSVAQSTSSISQDIINGRIASGLSTTTTYAFSIELEAFGDADWVELTTKSATGSAIRSWINIATGTAGTSNHTGGVTIKRVTGNIYRYTILAATEGSDTSLQYWVSMRTGNGNSGPFAGVATDGANACNGQMELGGFATSNIATSGSTVARAADVISLATSKFAYGAQEHMLFAEFDLARTAVFSAVTLSASVSDRVQLDASSPSTYRISGSGFGGTSPNDNFGTQSTGKHRYAAAFDENDLAAGVDGTIGHTASNTGTFPTPIDDLFVGTSFEGTAPWLNGHIRSIIYTPTRETNAALQARSA